MNRVARGLLPDPEMDNWPTLVAGDDIAVDVAHEPIDSLDSLWRRLAARENGAVSIAENAVDGVNPGPGRAIPESVSTRRVGGDHSAERTEISARWIDGEAQALSSRGYIQRRPENSRLCPDCSVSFIDSSEMIDAGEIYHHAGPNRSARHATSRAAWDQLGTRLGCPLHKGDDIFRVDRNGN